MPTIHPGFEYDIFISYRQNDNRSRWVTEFVKDLNEELAAAIKDPVSIYFDSNPFDGLLETHSVDKSLERKMKCLVFIPILSQTYCDTKSFAWGQEFCAFIKMAKEDPLGIDINLPNRNVASRVLPISIHELDSDDRSLLEKELGGVLRSIEFIYKEAGVNRPLKPDDKKDDNLNKTTYANQVNKTANAIKDLIQGIRHPHQPLAAVTRRRPDKPRTARRWFTSLMAALVVLITIVFGYYYFGGGSTTQSVEERSIAVIPFVNLSNDPEQEYFSDGMTDELLNRLFKVSNLRVISRTSSMKFKGAKLTTKEIAGILGVTNLLEGSVQKAGNRLKISIQLIDVQSDSHLWSETYERELSDVFAIQSEIAQAVARELRGRLSTSAKESLSEIPTHNQLAYEFYLRGLKEHERNFTGGSVPSTRNAISLMSKALDEDSLFELARYIRIHGRLWIYYLGREEKEEMGNLLSMADKDIRFLEEESPRSISCKLALALRNYWVDGDFDEALELYREIQKEDPGNSLAPHYISNIQRRLGHWEESITITEQLLKADPLNDALRYQLLWSYLWTRRHDNVVDLAKYGISLSPASDVFPLFMTASLLGKGMDLNAASREVNRSSEGWTRFMGIDFMDKGNVSVLDKRRREGNLVRIDQRTYAPIQYDYSLSNYLTGNVKIARTYADSAILLLSEKLKETPNDERLHATVGKCYAIAGKSELAIQHGRRAVDLLPVSEDAFRGPAFERDLAETYILLGEHERALDRIEMLLSIPSDLSVGLMMAYPIYEPLRELPKFKQLANKYRYQGTSAQLTD